MLFVVRLIFFKKGFWWTHVLFGGHWYPCFGFLGFKAKVGSALFAFSGGKCNVHFPRSTSGATHADLQHAYAEVGLGSYSNGQSPGQETKALPLCQRPSCSVRLTYCTHIPSGRLVESIITCH